MSHWNKSSFFHLLLLLLCLQKNAPLRASILSTSYNFCGNVMSAGKGFAYDMLFDEKAALKYSLVALGLWSIPYCFSLARHAWKKRTVQKRIGNAEPTNENIANIVNQNFTTSLSIADEVAYDQLDQQQFHSQRTNAYRSQDLNRITKIITDYYNDDASKESEIKELQQAAQYAPIQSDALISLASIPAIPTAWTCMWYYGRLISCGAKVITRGCSYPIAYGGRLAGLLTLGVINRLVGLEQQHNPLSRTTNHAHGAGVLFDITIAPVRTVDTYRDTGKLLFANASYYAALVAINTLVLKRLN